MAEARYPADEPIMWPWEHAAVGYLLFSPSVHAVCQRAPRGPSVLVLAAATQLPDVVDKTLSWGLGLFPTGFSVAHSVFVAVPVGLAVFVAANRTDRRTWGIALAVGYWSHLLADVVDPLRYGAGVRVNRVLWPLVVHEPYSQQLGLARGFVYLREFVATLPETDLTSVTGLYLLTPVLAVLLWLLDGTPGPATLYRILDRVRQ